MPGNTVSLLAGDRRCDRTRMQVGVDDIVGIAADDRGRHFDLGVARRLRGNEICRPTRSCALAMNSDGRRIIIAAVRAM